MSYKRRMSQIIADARQRSGGLPDIGAYETNYTNGGSGKICVPCIMLLDGK